MEFPCGFFDGAAAKNIGGAGFILFLSSSHSIHFSMGCGKSTNTKSKLMALWALLSVSKIMGIPLHSIFGDSLVIISWESGKGTLNLPHLNHWCDDVKDLLFFFQIWSWNTYIVSIIRLQIVSQNLSSLLNRALGFSRNISWTWLRNMVISSFISVCWPFKHIFEVYQQGSKLFHKETFCHLLMLIFLCYFYSYQEID